MSQERILLNTLGLQYVKPLVYRLNGAKGLSQNIKEFPDQEVEVSSRLSTSTDDAELNSYLGTPVFSDLTLKTNEQDVGLNIQTVLFDVQQSKNIVKTSIQGRPGTVKEYISDGDYEITINGIIVEPFSSAYPVSQVQDFLRLMRHQDSLIAICPFLQLFNVYNVVVESYNLPQQIGFQNQQVFSINAISDEPIELIEDV
jgi:hypothetical protein